MLMHFLLMTAKQEAKELGMELPEAAAQAIVHLVAGLHSEIIGFMELQATEELENRPMTGYGKKWSQEEIDRFEVELNRSMKQLMGNFRYTICRDVWHETQPADYLCPSCNHGRAI